MATTTIQKNNFLRRIKEFFFPPSIVGPFEPQEVPKVDMVALQQKVKMKEKEEQEKKERCSKARQYLIDTTTDIFMTTVADLEKKGIEFKKNPDLWHRTIQYYKNRESVAGSEDLTLVDINLASYKYEGREYKVPITNRRDKFIHLSEQGDDLPFMLFQPLYGRGIIVRWWGFEEGLRMEFSYRNFQRRYFFEFKVSSIKEDIENQRSDIEASIIKMIELAIERNLT